MDQVFTLLQKPLLNYLTKLGIVDASIIQKIAIPKILEGKNVLLIAPTGTGKTLAVVLPVFDMFLSLRSKGEMNGIKILYVTPLRALNRDIYRRVIALGDELGIKVKVRHGDTSTKEREMQSRFPPNMLITTPETLQAILPGKRLKEHLKAVEWVIVDEIHELAVDKRGVQLSLALERLRNLTGRDFQRIGLSATIGNPQIIAAFLAGMKREVEVVKSPESKTRDIQIEFNYPAESDVEDGKKISVPPSYISKIKRIIELASKGRSTLIFSNTREHAEAVGSLIKAINPTFPIMVHHGSLSRELRDEAERSLLDGRIRGIVCTSSLELGIDVGTADLVIHYMSPRQAVRLVQRVGRSGHSIDALPKGRIIASWADDILESVAIVKRVEEEDLEFSEIPDRSYDVLAHQIVGLSLDERRITLGKIFRIVKIAYPYQALNIEELQEVMSQIEKLGLIRVREETIMPRAPRAHRYYFENLSVIPDVKRYVVFDFIVKRKIGTLDQEFVAKRCNPRVKIIMHGHTWTVISRNDEKLKVEVEPAAPTLEAIPSWEGEIIPVDFKTALMVGQLREQFAANIVTNQTVMEGTQLHINKGALRKVIETLENHTKHHKLPTHGRILIESYENIIVVHACFGNKVNETLGMLLVSLMKSKYDSPFMYQVDPYRIGITCPHPFDPVIIKKILMSLKPSDIRTIIDSALLESEMFVWRHWHVARRFSIVEKKADYVAKRAKMLVKIFNGTIVCAEAKKEVYSEKLDLSSTETIIDHVVKGKISVDLAEGKEGTPLATPILDKLVPHSLLRPIIPSRPLVSIIEERLTSSTVKLVCIHKGDWEGIRVVGKLPETVRCPKCKSTLIATTYRDDKELIKAIKKKLRKGKLSVDEQSVWMRGWRSAGLIQIYGKKAILALAGYGIGPATATRVLKVPAKNKGEFYTNVLKAERLYARTRSFWD